MTGDDLQIIVGQLIGCYGIGFALGSLLLAFKRSGQALK